MPLLLAAFCLLALPPTAASGQWTEPKNAGWSSLTLYRQSTTDVYGATGVRTAYPLSGRATATSLFLTTDIGLGKAVDAWVQVSLQELEFSDLATVRRSRGLGDLRLFARWSPSQQFGWSLPVAIRGGVKIPVGDFDAFSSILPLGDGQTDLELVAEVGYSFWPHPAYVSAWAGYRWRRPQATTGFDFGNEPFFLVTGGWTPGRLGTKVVVEGLFGIEPEPMGVSTASQARRMVRLAPSLTVSVGPGSFEVGPRIPLQGRNLPAAADLSLGYFVRWGGSP